MIALFTEAPRFCPRCGEPIKFGRKPYGDQDWRAHCCHQCSGCKLRFQLADREHVIAAATASGGDLAQYAD